jgi:hypothetical protein
MSKHLIEEVERARRRLAKMANAADENEAAAADQQLEIALTRLAESKRKPTT